jgi:tRNA A37 threonylcarbamoyladenosine dehydratase
MYAFLRCNYTCFAVLFFSEKCVIKNWNGNDIHIVYFQIKHSHQKCLKNILKNPNITIKFIKENINKFNFTSLSSNHFTYIKKLFTNIHKKAKLFYYLYFTKLIYDLQRYSISTSNFQLFKKKLWQKPTFNFLKKSCDKNQLSTF